mmetsp:Transcript_3646/g.4014  ORF Transcript_3646/g.4014 Transcript_3646/m.4014 type:complete len:92 (+) Transcript_3646:42-317(+)
MMRFNDGPLLTILSHTAPNQYQHAGIPVILDEYEKGELIIQSTVIEDSLFRCTTGNLVNHSLEKYSIFRGSVRGVRVGGISRTGIPLHTTE